MSITAMRQALEALENSVDTVQHEYDTDWRHGMPTRKAQLDGMRVLLEQHQAAITSLRTAIEQAEKQEPVAWQGVHDKTDLYYRKPVQGDVRPLYTTLPAAQRQPEHKGCACRWDSEGDRTVTCERHEGWLEVIAEWADRAREAEAKLKAAAQQEPDAYGYASRLAVAIWEQHYKATAPQWKPLDDLMGVLTQIDNMTAGLTAHRQPLTDAEVLHLWAGDISRPVLGKNKVLAFARAIEAAHGIGGKA